MTRDVIIFNDKITVSNFRTLPDNFLHTGSQDSREIAVYDTYYRIGLIRPANDHRTFYLVETLSFESHRYNEPGILP